MLNGQDDIIWNGSSLKTLMEANGCTLYVTKLPAINKPARKQTKYTISGRSGTVVDPQDAWDNVTISYELAIADGDPYSIAGLLAEWMHSADDYATLADTFDAGHYRLGYIESSFSVENLMLKHARTTISFNCRPERYITDTTTTVSSGDTLTNPTAHIAKPLITINASKTPSLMMMTGRTTADDFTEESEVRWPLSSKKIAYTWANVYIATSLDGLKFGYDGTNLCTYTTATGQIAVKNGGGGRSYACLNRSVKPNTTYYFNCSASSDSTSVLGPIPQIYVYETDSDGDILTYRKMNWTSNADGTDKFSDSFTTSADAYWIVMCFSCANASGKTITYSKIQLNTGKESEYLAYGSSTAGNVIINDIKVGLSEVSDGLTIDTETEQVYCGDANCNDITAIRVRGDDDGSVWNVGENFPYLEPGDNVITFAGSTITSVTIDPRYWTL